VISKWGLRHSDSGSGLVNMTVFRACFVAERDDWASKKVSATFSWFSVAAGTFF